MFTFDPKFTSVFSGQLQCIVSEDTDFFLAKASLDNLQGLVPDDVKGSENIDLLPVVFNVTVAGRGNENGDCIDPKTAIAIYKKFINRPINIAHNRKETVGHIVSAGLSEFGTDKPLTEDEAKELDVFNIALSGVIYRVVNNELAKLIEEASDPSSPHYMRVHASWEIAFENYKIVKGSKILSEAEIVSDEKFSEYNRYLKCNRGSGKDKNGDPVYRLITNEVGWVMPLGAGKTLNPAGDVRGVLAVASRVDSPENDKEEAGKIAEAAQKDENNNKDKENISLSKQTNVKVFTSDMNIKSVKDIESKWEDLKKHESAASIVDFVVKELEDKSADYVSKVKEKENSLKEAQAEIKRISEEFESLKQSYAEKEALEKEVNSQKQELDSLKKKLEESKTALAEIQKEQAEREREEAFNARMEAIASEYDLDDDMSKAVAAEINGLDEDSFKTWKSRFDIIAKHSKRTAQASTEEDEEEKIKQAFASVKQKNTVHHSAPENEENLKERFKSALSDEEVTIS